MQNEEFDILETLNLADFNEFTKNQDVKYNLSTDLHSVEFDYTWIDKIEETIPYLDNVIRDPKKFLAQEEEVVPVEKAKKISMETIKHLAQHTNLIQDVSEDGKITPSAVLNIHKEETYELYENRFINSLLQNLYTFIKTREKAVSEGSFYKSEKNLDFKVDTKMNGENISLTLKMEASAYDEGNSKNSNGLTYSERIEKITFILLDFMKTPLIKSLVQAPPVRSPIRKTNAILKNTNFKKALELWEYIERYDHHDRKEVKENFKTDKDKEIENNLMLATLLNYNILSKAGKQDKIIKDSNYYLKKIIKDFVGENKDLNITEFKSILSQTFAKYKKQRELRYKRINIEINKKISAFYSMQKDAIKLLKG